ncbi:FliM/FliN family flagellar motor switch protein [Pseudomonas sp. CDFA 602]|uniref:FliM/FliN family flagellar motor switch protein n=1 Tax=Pseudomonas californiensis TaxID=2829823 RepID=UPI001E654CE2|nr:FliM/FliN family flagellar motor switch protein [Pseudomonas californiensis]MCD5993872.1 FliM/FliN family flagellar motor switch protein [Pseudomonas californiensis]MCD5999625.1 FliM/FliN family flagellar motor switch protein [Pseudomonas californiensis]
MSNEDLYQDDVDTLEDDERATDYADRDEHDHAFNADDHNQQHWAGADEDHQEGELEDQQAQQAVASEAPPDRAAFESLELELTLRCGQLKLTLGELRRLDAGTVLEVAGIAPGYATLCHGERVVAEGELVDVDGRLGLQITRMVTQP